MPDVSHPPHDGWYQVIEEGSKRVMRGGCWDNVARNCRSAGRGQVTPDGGGFYLGFRVAWSASQNK
jgi:formylglycine-generating enzyme required for sulfatase activity